MARCFGYGRASTDMQEATEDAQREEVERFYARHLKPAGVQWAGFFYDAATSGGSAFTEREEGLKVWVLSQPGDYVLARHADRFFRNTADAVTTMQAMESKGVVLQTCDAPLRQPGKRTAAQEFGDTVLAAVGHYSKRVTGERTSNVMRSLVAKGVRFGRALQSAPFGWMRHGDGLVPDQEERNQIEQMAHWRVVEGLSFAKIALRVQCHPYGWRRRYAVGRSTGWNDKYVRLALVARDQGYPRAFQNSRRRRGGAGRTHASSAP